MKKRILSLFLTLAMTIGILPATAGATGTEEPSPCPANIYSYVVDETVENIGTLAYDGDNYPVYFLKFDSANYDTFQLTCSDDSTYDNGYADSDLNLDLSLTNITYDDTSRYASAKSWYASTDTSSLSITKNENADYLLILLGKDGRGVSPKGFLIIEWEKAASVDKTDLAAAITAAPSTAQNGDDEYTETDYYHEDDRYNGTTYAGKDASFWASYVTAYNAAVTVNDSDSALQSEVDAATEALTAAIDNLIPTSEPNTTTLYEYVNVYTRNSDGSEYTYSTAYPSVDGSYSKLSSGDYPDYRWDAWDDAYVKAYNTLNGLYTNGVYNNNISESDITKITDDYLAAHRYLIFSTTLESAETARQRITMLNEVFTATDSAGYESTSWSAYDTAKTAANSSLTTFSSESAYATDSDVTTMINNAEAYWDACYGLTESGAITINLTINDNYGAYDATYALKDGNTSTFSGEFTMANGEHSMKDLFEAFEWGTDSDDTTIAYLVYINGQAVIKAEYDGTILFKSTSYYLPTNESIQLRDGDDVRLIRIINPIGNYYGWGSSADYDNVSPYLAVYDFTELEVTSESYEEGSAFAVTVKSTSAEFFEAGNATTQAAKNKQIIAYGPMVNGEYPATPIQTGAYTDSSGVANVTLYEAGTYRLIAVDTAAMSSSTGEYPNIAGGAATEVAISALTGSDLTTAIAAQLADLEAVYSSTSAAQLANVSGWSTVTEAYETAKATIESATSLVVAQTAVAEATATIEATIAEATATTESKLSTFETYLLKLPTVEQIEAGLMIAGFQTNANDLLGYYIYLTEYEKTQLTTGQIAWYTAIEAAYSDYLANGWPEGEKLTVEIVLDADVIPAGFTVSYYNISGKGYTDLVISDGEIDSLSIEPGTQFVLRTYSSLANPVTQITVTGDTVDSSTIGSTSEIMAHYVYFDNLTADATFTISFGEGDSLLSERNAALTSLDTAYASYSKSSYSTSNWNDLVDAYSTGVSEINSAEDTTAITSALNTATAAMAAVKTLKDVAAEDEELEDTEVGEAGSVYVTIENTTYSAGNFYGSGSIANDQQIALNDDDTMMTVVLAALDQNGYTWTGTGATDGDSTGYTITYLSSVTKGDETLGEFSGSSASGWMGTLNDWFTNEGFQSFKVSTSNKDYQLRDGDEICVMFTDDLGADLGGTWGNADTFLDSLKASTGTLTPTFDSEQLSYTLSTTGKVTFTYEAANKNYQVRTYLNETSGDNWYRSGESISVKAGDVINIGIGGSSWPSMNNQGTEAISYSATWYTIYITDSSDASTVISLISAIESITYSNYERNAAAAEFARTAYEALTADAQGKVTNYSTLTTAEEKIEFYSEIDEVKDLLADLLSSSSASDTQVKSAKSAIEAADAAYKALTADQQAYITVGDVANYNLLVDRLDDLTTTSAGSIKGNEETPEEEIVPPTTEGETVTTTVKIEATVDKDGNAKAEISHDTVDAAIEEVVKAADETEGETVKEVKLEVTVDGDAKSVETTIPKETVSELNDKVDVVTLETPVATISLDADTLTTIADEASGDVSIKAAVVTIPDNTPDEIAGMIGDNNVYSFEIASGDKKISEFGGAVTVSIPYTLKDGEDARKLTVYYIAEDGSVKEMPATYDADKQCMVMTTTHFFVFAVAYDESKIVFDDVATTDWFYDAVAYVVNAGLFNGISDDEFAPNSNMTRAMIWTVLARASDVDTSTSDPWYQIGMDWAMETGISDGTNPDGNVTREQLATMLYRYSNETAVTADLSGYTDLANVSDWALEAMNWAVSKGIVTGKTTTTLEPSANATRAEVATMMMRYLEQ